MQRKPIFGIADDERQLLRAAHRLQVTGSCARTTAYSGMKARTLCPIAPKLPTKAPATSAKPPVFAYGTISELNMHSFNGVMKTQSNKRRPAERNLVQAPSECVTLRLMRHAARNNTGRYVSRLTSGTLAVIMAGGRGERLKALTQHRCKPATPFGGKFRIIDFVLSNCVNSGIRQIAVLTQYKSQSLIQHIQRGWSYLRGELGEFVELIPAQQQIGQHWYRGTADSVYQNLDFIRSHHPTHVLILAGDHIYKMDYGPMIAYHEQLRGRYHRGRGGRAASNAPMNSAS